MARPNIILHGRFRVNPPTANNNNVDELVDVERTGLVAQLSAARSEKLIGQLKQIKEVEIYWGVGNHMPCYWNYFGDNAFTWEDVKVTAVDEFPSQEHTSSDKALGAVATLTGHPRHDRPTQPVMFQLDPTDAISAQIIADRLEVRGEGCRLQVEGLSRAHLRDLNAFRLPQGNGPRQVSGVFQTAAASADVRIEPGESRALAALSEELRNGRKLVVTYCLYDCGDPPLDPDAMQRALLEHDKIDPSARAPRGEARGPRNPKSGRIAVVISTAAPGALASMPSGRRLIPPAVDMEPARLGPAYVHVDSQTAVLTLNTMSSLPEELAENGVPKQKLGALTLFAIDDAGQKSAVLKLSEAEYADYARNAGVFRIQLSAEQWTSLRKACLAIELESGGTLLEQEFVLASDQRNIYLEHDGEQQIQVLVTRRGAPAPRVRLQLGVWQSAIERRADNAGIPRSPLQNFHKSDDPSVELEAGPIETDEAGLACFRIWARRPGAALVCYWIDGTQPPPESPTWKELELYSFSAVRVLPDDSALAKTEPLRWEDVFEHVLKPYTVLYPAMSEVFGLDDPASVRSYAKSIAESMDESAWAKTTYMPISRDLSRGKREMLLRWLAQEQP